MNKFHTLMGRTLKEAGRMKWTLCAAILLTFQGLQVSSHRSSPEVILRLGKLRGLEEVSTEGRPFYSFLGIPYARPPLGPLRLKDPVPNEAWNDTLDATRMPNMCPQVTMLEIISFKDGLPKIQGTEDCLYLNVFTPKPIDSSASLPVMFYIHGGSYVLGTASEHPPYYMLNEDIVLVVINYRLGTLGFLSTEDHVIPGNFGLKDQTLALRWVQEHIAHFGGDPRKVTVFGESAGAASAHIQSIIPEAEGLFSRIILQSGNALCPWAFGSSHKEVAFTIAHFLKCPQNTGSVGLLECFQRAPAYALTLANAVITKIIILPLLMGPRVDGRFIPDCPENILKNKAYTSLDVVAGVTKDEGGLFTAILLGKKFLMDKVNANFEQLAPSSLEIRGTDRDSVEVTNYLYEHYTGKRQLDVSLAENLTRLYSDRLFFLPHDTAAGHIIRNSGQFHKTFLYEFHYKGERSIIDSISATFDQNSWIVHMDDLHYLFGGGPILKELSREADVRMAKSVRKLWTNFALNGLPTPDDSLGFWWSPATMDSLQHLRIDREPRMEEDSRQSVRRFWRGVRLRGDYPRCSKDAARGEGSK